MSLVTLAGVSLQQLLDQAGNPARMLRSLPAMHYKMPFDPEYTTWRDEQRAWKETTVLFDQSHHMMDLYVKGPDVKRLFSDPGSTPSRRSETTRPGNSWRETTTAAA